MLRNVDILQGGLWDLAMQFSTLTVAPEQWWARPFRQSQWKCGWPLWRCRLCLRAKISFLFSFCAGNSTANMVQYNYYVPCTPSLCHPCLMSPRSSWHVSTPLGSRCVPRAPAIPRRTPNAWSRRLGKHQHIRWRSARPSHQSSHCSPILALSAIRGHLTQRCQCRHLCEHWSILHWSPICRLEFALPRSHSSWLCAHKCHEATVRTGGLQDWRSSQGAQQRVHRVYPCQASGPSCWGYFFRYLWCLPSSFPQSSARRRLRLWEARKAKTRATAATCPSRPPWAWEKPQAAKHGFTWYQMFDATRSEHQMLPWIQTNPRNWNQKLKKRGPNPSWIIYLTTQAEVVRSFYPSSSKRFEFEAVSPCWRANFFIFSKSGVLRGQRRRLLRLRQKRAKTNEEDELLT